MAAICKRSLRVLSRQRLASSLQHRYFSAIGPPKNILFINSVGSQIQDKEIYNELNELVPQFTTNVKYDVCSFKPEDKPTNPNKQEWDTYYNQTIVKTIRWAKYQQYDGVIIGDVSITPMAVLLNTQNVSDFGHIKITSLGEAACIVAKQSGNTFSMIIGYKHLIPRFKENLIKHGFEDAFKNFHVLYDGDLTEQKEFHWDKKTILNTARTALQQDKCGAIILAACCDLETCGMAQTRYPKIPMIYPEMAAMKYCEMLIDNARNQGFKTRQKVNVEEYQDVLADNAPIGHIIGNTDLDNKTLLK